ncbi:hypothetical protein [Roseomonas sp. BN140053]|uniref:hypothetical protein n=1 Tax=Roseomonas sp. BN140053 TaxID=3391898 RepID=UPI0039EAB49B
MPGDVGLRARRQRIEIRAGTVLGVGFGTAALLAVTLGGVYGYFHWAGVRTDIPRPARFPEPRVQSDPAGDLRDLQAAQRAQLEGYAWVDRERGLIRIPVARAMAILAARGEAALAPLEAPDPAVPMPVRPEAARRAEGGR